MSSGDSVVKEEGFGLGFWEKSKDTLRKALIAEEALTKIGERIQGYVESEDTLEKSERIQEVEKLAKQVVSEGMTSDELNKQLEEKIEKRKKRQQMSSSKSAEKTEDKKTEEEKEEESGPAPWPVAASESGKSTGEELGVTDLAAENVIATDIYARLQRNEEAIAALIAENTALKARVKTLESNVNQLASVNVYGPQVYAPARGGPSASVSGVFPAVELEKSPTVFMID